VTKKEFVLLQFLGFTLGLNIFEKYCQNLQPGSRLGHLKKSQIKFGAVNAR